MSESSILIVGANGMIGHSLKVALADGVAAYAA
jgi:dTDP-4-dehydrorhamnose reductase